MQQKQTVLVKHLRYPLTAALERLMTKDPVRHPFVIVEADNTDSFLQYAGSSGERLIFDVPQQNIHEMECDGVAHAVLSAEQLIEKNWQLGDDDTVTIIEHEDNGIKRRVNEWLDKLREKLGRVGEPGYSIVGS